MGQRGNKAQSDTNKRLSTLRYPLTYQEILNIQSKPFFVGILEIGFNAYHTLTETSVYYGQKSSENHN